MTSNSKSFNLATPETHRRSSQDLANEAQAEMQPDDDPVTPTPNPTAQPTHNDGMSEMQAMFHQFQQFMAERDAQQQGRIDRLEQMVQQTSIAQQQQPVEAAQPDASIHNPSGHDTLT